MNMLSSLKALLFSSTAVQSPSEGTGAGPLPMLNAADFADLFSGSLADAAQAAKATLTTDAAQPAPTGEATPDLNPAPAMAEPGNNAIWQRTDASFPPGLPLGLHKHVAALPMSPAVVALPTPPAVSGEATTFPTAPAVPGEAPALPTAPVLPGEAAAVEGALPEEAAPVEAPHGSARGHDKLKTMPMTEQIEDAEAPAAADAEPTDAAEKTQPDQKSVEASVGASAVPIQPAPVAVVIEPLSPQPAPQGKTPPAEADAPRAVLPASALQQPQQPPQLAERAIETNVIAMPGAPSPRAEAPPIAPEARAPVDASAPLPMAGQVAEAGDLPQPAAPVLNGKPMKSEALALLQLVREQVAVRQSGAPIRVGQQVSAAASARHESKAPAVDMTPVAPAPSPDVTPQPAPSQPVAPSVAAPSAPVADLSASLGAQVVDMGVSGQWIDGLARDIAGLSANGAQGRFQINADQLGTVQVDIRQGSDGAAVNLTVATEAAELALRQDSDRLKLDAGLSAVRIAEVKIERAPVAQAAGADAPGQQSQQQQQSQHSSSHAATAWQTGSQDMSQPQGQQGQQGRWQARQNNGFDPKSSDDPSVLNHAEARQGARETVRARYA